MAHFLPLADALAACLRDGDTVAFEGFTHLIPFAAAHEAIRQQRKKLTLVRMTPDLIYDQMIVMGCASKLIFSWGGNPGVTREAVQAATGWKLRFAPVARETPPPTDAELAALRALLARTAQAHGAAA